MEKYNKLIAKNEKIEMIHVSLDRENDAAISWAKKEKFPWLTVLPKDAKESGLRQYEQTDFVPEYTLVSADGEIVAVGDDEAFAEIEKLK